MIFVLHVDGEPAQAMIDGRLLIIPPNELFEVPEIRGMDCNNNGPVEYLIPDKLVAQKLIQHCWFHGLVEVPMVRTKGGVTSDIDAARASARTALETAQDSMLTKYVQDQQERVTRDNKPAIAPSAPLEKIIRKRGIDLKRDFNIDPPAWNIGKSRDRDAEFEALKEAHDKMTKQFDELLARLGDNAEAAKKK